MDGAIPANVMSLPGGRVVFCGEEKQPKSRSTRSTENGWRHTGKCDVTARGACGFLWRGEAAKITEYTEYRKW